MGIVQEKYQVVFRCNLVNVDNEKMVDFSAGHIDSEIAAKLIETLDEELGTEGLRFYPGIGYRHILSIDTRKFSYDFPKLNCTPPHDIMGQSIAKYLPEGHRRYNNNHILKSLFSLHNTLGNVLNLVSCSHRGTTIFMND
jgi:2,3-bisphosphoglycerate-independent phosphoglycerate mutase